MPTPTSYSEQELHTAGLYLDSTHEVLPLHKATQPIQRRDKSKHENHSARLVGLK